MAAHVKLIIIAVRTELSHEPQGPSSRVGVAKWWREIASFLFNPGCQHSGGGTDPNRTRSSVPLFKMTPSSFTIYRQIVIKSRLFMHSRRHGGFVEGKKKKSWNVHPEIPYVQQASNESKEERATIILFFVWHLFWQWQSLSGAAAYFLMESFLG